MKTPRAHPQGEKETGTGEMTGEEVEVALRDTETVVMTIDSEMDVRRADTKKTTTMTDTAEVIKRAGAEVLLLSLKEDLGLRHQIGVEKVKGINTPEITPRSTNNRNQMETDERANTVRRFEVDIIVCYQ